MNDLQEFELTRGKYIYRWGTNDSNNEFHGTIYTNYPNSNTLGNVIEYSHGKVNGLGVFYTIDSNVPYCYVVYDMGFSVVKVYVTDDKVDKIEEWVRVPDGYAWKDIEPEDYDRILKKYDIDINYDPRNSLKRN